jgi:hypothetical protein
MCIISSTLTFCRESIFRSRQFSFMSTRFTDETIRKYFCIMQRAYAMPTSSTYFADFEWFVIDLVVFHLHKLWFRHHATNNCLQSQSIRYNILWRVIWIFAEVDSGSRQCLVTFNTIRITIRYGNSILRRTEIKCKWCKQKQLIDKRILMVLSQKD